MLCLQLVSAASWLKKKKKSMHVKIPAHHFPFIAAWLTGTDHMSIISGSLFSSPDKWKSNIHLFPCLGLVHQLLRKILNSLWLVKCSYFFTSHLFTLVPGQFLFIYFSWAGKSVTAAGTRQPYRPVNQNNELKVAEGWIELRGSILLNLYCLRHVILLHKEFPCSSMYSI